MRVRRQGGGAAEEPGHAWAVETTNVARLRLSGPHLAGVDTATLDGTRFDLGGEAARDLCRAAQEAAWVECVEPLDEVDGADDAADVGGGEEGGECGGAASQLTATSATAASPRQELPRVYLKANDGE